MAGDTETEKKRKTAFQKVYFKIKPLSAPTNDKDANILHVHMYICTYEYIRMQLRICGQTFAVPNEMHINCGKCYPLLCLSPTHTRNSYAQFVHVS